MRCSSALLASAPLSRVRVFWSASGACPNSALGAVDLGWHGQSLSISPKGRRSCQDLPHLVLMNGGSCRATKHGIFVGGSNFKHASRSTIGAACCCDPRRHACPRPAGSSMQQKSWQVVNSRFVVCEAHIAWLMSLVPDWRPTVDSAERYFVLLE